MALEIPGMKNIFKHSSSVDTGLGKERIGQATIIVSQDGSGDVNSIQEGINLLPKTGGVVYIKEGTYTITSPINISIDNVKLTGAGRASIISTAENITMLRINIVSGTIIEQLQFKGAGTGNSLNRGIYIDTAPQTYILGCQFFECGSLGVETSGAFQCWILNNDFRDGFGSGAELGGPGFIIFSNNRIINNALNGLLLTTSRDNIISNNIFLDNGTTTDHNCISLEGGCDRNNITGNYLHDSTGYGIKIASNTSDENLIMNNVFDRNDLGAVSDTGTNTHPNGVSGTNNLALDDLNILT